MSTFTVTSRAYPTLLPTPEDLPKCTCGGKFIVEDIFNKRRVHQLTSAVCEDCGEYFCGYNLNDLYRSIPSGQKARAVNNSSYKIKREIIMKTIKVEANGVMNAQELRLGNILQDESGRQCTVTRIRQEDVQVRYMIDGKEKHSYVDCEHLEGMMLTEKWLEGMGFYTSRPGCWHHKEIKGWLTKYTSEVGVYAYQYNIFHICEFRHVHHLQNLYFALTAEELEVK